MKNPETSTELLPHRGGLIIVLAMLGLVCLCFPVGLIAFVLSRGDLKKMDAGLMDPNGRSFVRLSGFVGLANSIISFLIVTIIPCISFFNSMVATIQRNAKSDAAYVEAKMIEAACMQYRLDIGSFPQSLDNLVVRPEGAEKQLWNGPYLDADQIPTDPWDNKYQLEIDQLNDNVSIFSRGSDGIKGTWDDISSDD